MSDSDPQEHHDDEQQEPQKYEDVGGDDIHDDADDGDGGGGGDGGGDGGQPPPIDDEDDEEPVPTFLPSDHRLMAPIQAALRKQLEAREDRVTVALREREAGLASIRKRREELGVELYSTQQGLAKLQLELEKRHAKYEAASVQRSAAEAALKAASARYQQMVLQRDELESKRSQAQKELDALHVTVQQIDAWNEKVKSEIKITRGQAYGTEDAMQAAEKEKARQDAQLEKLSEDVRRRQEQIALYDAQIENQKRETAKASATLKEAREEMERIVAEKKKFVSLWQTSLQGMAQRDAALQAAQQAVHEQQEQLQSLALSLAGYKSAIKAEQETNEKLSSIQTRIQGEIKFMESALETIAETRKAYNAKYQLFRQTLERVDAELKTQNAEQKVLRGEIDVLHKSYEKLMSEKQSLDDAIMESINDQTTLEKGAANVWKLTQKLKQQVHEQERAMGEVQNEIARIQVDSLNTGAHNKELQQTLDAYEKELKEKIKLIEKYEMEIRQRHDKIEKKQIYIARLNRKYEVLTSNVEEENTGPLEATISNLQKELNNVAKEVSEKQREWIRVQTELVGLVADAAAVGEEARELESRETIFRQKMLRSSNQVQSLRRETKEIGQSIKSMHNDMSRLNELIASQHKLHDELTNGNFTMEQDFMVKLKQLELKSVELDELVVRLRDEKAAIFAELVEVEKQILLWEKKIQLERETQEALDPEYGQPEIKAMRKEIHRMKLRLTQLKKQQEKMIQEMERTIAKKDTIKIATTSSKNSAALTAAQLKKKLQSLKVELSATSKESQRVSADISKQEEQNSLLAEELEKQQRVYNTIEDAKMEIQNKMEETLFKKQMSLEATILQQKRARRYEDAIAGRSHRAVNKEKVSADLVAAQQRAEKIKQAVTQLQELQPKHAEYFGRLLAYM